MSCSLADFVLLGLSEKVNLCYAITNSYNGYTPRHTDDRFDNKSIGMRANSDCKESI